MNPPIRPSQNQGQATIEALLFIVFGFSLVLFIHHTGQIRSHTLHLLGESHFLSLVPMRVVDAQDQSVQSPIVNVETVSFTPLNQVRLKHRYANVRLNDSIYSAKQLVLENQLGFDSAAMLRASAQSALELRNEMPAFGLNWRVPLMRHSFVLTGYGQAGSTQAAQATIAGSTALWQTSFSHSKLLVNNSAVSLQSIDRAWGRVPMTASWLVPWANEGWVTNTSGQALSSHYAQSVEQTQGSNLK